MSILLYEEAFSKSGEVWVAGEEVPAELITTRLSIEVSPRSGTVPFTVSITGDLVKIEDAALVPLEGTVVRLYENDVYVAWDYTTRWPTKGEYAFTREIREPGSYTYFTEFPGDTLHKGCRSIRVEVTAEAAVPPPPPPAPSKALEAVLCLIPIAGVLTAGIGEITKRLK